ncbi:hypothetical protein [Bibersteinia trehalosi]|uniref:hypothetical protein n=1 Tax=Bibersteinia trehalosi TaxID=47735 RepID=UPI00046CA535|nr:hypothetical protein [Bibersteinia trehalosi]
MNIVSNKARTFGIAWDEECQIGSYKYGKVKIIIGHNIFPKEDGGNYTLQTVFSNMKDSFLERYYPSGKTNGEFGEKEFVLDKWNKLELKDIFVIEVSELGGYSHVNTLELCMAYSGDEERLFYSFDNGESFNEIRYPKGTIEGVINLLPDYSP